MSDLCTMSMVGESALVLVFRAETLAQVLFGIGDML